MELLSYDFYDEFILEYLAALFKTKYNDKDLYTKHSLDNLDFFREMKSENVRIEEESRFIRIAITFNSKIPAVLVYINKDNNRLSRVYVERDDDKLGQSFDINDEKIMDLINLKPMMISTISKKVAQIKEEEKENIKIKEQVSNFLKETVNQKNLGLEEKMSGEIFATYYGLCIIFSVGKIKVFTKRYRIDKNGPVKGKDLTEESVQKFIEAKANEFIHLQEKQSKRKK